ncbi:hypothetical protein [Photobacterium indicum]|uniref:hypothetical protein n=1 Tax=Photobacterium indicum TaxID=81447 RepID=UPI003D12052E
MPLHSLTDVVLRQSCKEAVEALEFWLRRVIDITLAPEFGFDYINAKSSSTNQNIIKKSVRDSIQSRAASNPNRYPRMVDAMLLDEEVDIVCHPDLYKQYFKEYFECSYPFGNDQLRHCLRKILEPRNNLAHANPISIRQAEQIICYSHDVIDAIKARLREKNLDREYNAPTIIKVSDSRGFVFHDSQIRRNNTGRGGVDLTGDQSTWLRSGDTVSVEVEIDPSFSAEEYVVDWVFPERVNVEKYNSNNRVVLQLTDDNVRVDFTIYCKVVSTKNWHRCGDVDDCVGITYKVLPTI